MNGRRKKTYLMQLIERDHANTPIEKLMIEAYQKCGTERAAAQALGVTQQSFNAWKFRLGIEQTMLDQRAKWLEIHVARLHRRLKVILWRKDTRAW